jgi:hypothetical protein
MRRAKIKVAWELFMHILATYQQSRKGRRSSGRGISSHG